MHDVAEPPVGGQIVGQLVLQEQWQPVCATLETHAKWQAEKPPTKAASLGVEKLRLYQDPRFREAVQALIAADQAVAQEIDTISQVEKLILYQCWILEFVNNFVSFPRLYDPEARALFETGTLVMDGRQFTLCVKVDNRAAHVRVAQNSKLFILYLELTQTATSERRAVATAVTSGGIGNLYVGKHGIFFAHDGQLWDASVTQIIENPISLAEALTLPFRRIGRLIQSQVERFAGSGQKLLEERVSRRATSVATTVQATAEKAQLPARSQAAATGRGGRDLLLTGSIAIAALGSAFAFITKQLQDVNPMTIVKMLCLVLLLVLIPTIINAWVRLRQRDLGTLLEACGWAINGRIRLTRAMQGVFTRRPGLPPNATKYNFDCLRDYARFRTKPFGGLRQQITEIGKDAWEAL